jgi:hypothetical protein
MAAISTYVSDEIKDAVIAEKEETGRPIAKIVAQALKEYQQRREGAMFDFIEDIEQAEKSLRADSVEFDSVLKDAELAFYDAYTNGSHAAWVHESERLAQAIERRYNLAKARCPYCAGEECSH